MISLSTPPKRLKSKYLIWDLKPTKDYNGGREKKRGKASILQNASLIDNSKLRVPGLELPKTLYGQHYIEQERIEANAST